MADALNRSVTSSKASEQDGERSKRKIRFLPLPQSATPELSLQQAKVWSPLRGLRVRTSVWLWIAIVCLVLANVLFMVAFLTNGWGILYVEQDSSPIAQPPTQNQNVVTSPHSTEPTPRNLDILFGSNAGSSGGGTGLFAENERYWKFGLWECCRNDGFCLGTRWPAFYSATRAFAVLGLLAQLLTLAWLIGHALENLLEYDPCTVVALIALNLAATVFVLLCVVCFGTRWPIEFANEFHGVSTQLDYSFYLAVSSLIFLAGSSALSITDFVVSLRSLAMFDRQSWVTADEILGDEYAADGGIEERSYLRTSSYTYV